MSSPPERRLWLPRQLPEQTFLSPELGMQTGDLMKITARDRTPTPRQWQEETGWEQKHRGQGAEIYRLTKANRPFGSSFYR